MHSGPQLVVLLLRARKEIMNDVIRTSTYGSK